MQDRTRLALLATALAAYAVLAHQLTAHAGSSLWALLAVLGPMLALLLAGLWRSGQRWLCAGLAAVLAWLAVQVERGGGIAPQWLFLAQHAGIHAALALLFGRTLLPGQQALISAMAERVHRGLTPTLATYTRRLTAAWTAYFVGVALTSLLLFVAAPLEVWSLFANVITPLLLVGFFAGEHLLRYRWHPEFERISVTTVIRAYEEHQRTRQSGRRPRAADRV